jgi:hypothetical protein
MKSSVILIIIGLTAIYCVAVFVPVKDFKQKNFEKEVIQKVDTSKKNNRMQNNLEKEDSLNLIKS